jgi:hypothetical protein
MRSALRSVFAAAAAMGPRSGDVEGAAAITGLCDVVDVLIATAMRLRAAAAAVPSFDPSPDTLIEWCAPNEEPSCGLWADDSVPAGDWHTDATRLADALQQLGERHCALLQELSAVPDGDGLVRPSRCVAAAAVVQACVLNAARDAAAESLIGLRLATKVNIATS